MAHLIQHIPAGEGAELAAPDAILTVKIDAEHTDGDYELFEVDAPRGAERVSAGRSPRACQVSSRSSPRCCKQDPAFCMRCRIDRAGQG